MVATTKAFFPVTAEDGSKNDGHRLSRKQLIHTVDDSLVRLQTDNIGLFYVYMHNDETPPLEETRGEAGRVLNRLVMAGKIHFASVTIHAG